MMQKTLKYYRLLRGYKSFNNTNNNTNWYWVFILEYNKRENIHIYVGVKMIAFNK